MKLLPKRSHLNGSTVGFRAQTQKLEILLKRFHLNGNTVGFRPGDFVQTQKLEIHTK